MDKQEKIVSPAVEFEYFYRGDDPDCDDKPIAREVVMCIHYDDERIESKRDAHFMYDTNVREKKGFITSKNRFVDAKEAMRIAISQCQIYSVELLYRELNTHNASPRYDNWQLHHDQIKAGIALMESSLLARELKPEDLY